MTLLQERCLGLILNKEATPTGSTRCRGRVSVGSRHPSAVGGARAGGSTTGGRAKIWYEAGSLHEKHERERTENEETTESLILYFHLFPLPCIDHGSP